MENMQAVYDEELGRGRGGLMSLMRGMGDLTLGEDIMNNLPDILAMLQNTNKDTLTMRQTEEMGEPNELAVTLSNTPGLESLLTDELAMILGMPSPGKKVGIAKDGFERFLKVRDELMDQRATDFFEGPAGEKAMKIDRRMIQRMMDENPKVGPREMAGGGRPGLYANIAAKRRRIKAGSGEKMRKAGSKGAPTKENFRQAATTAKKAAGGALNYSKGYYGKSYK